MIALAAGLAVSGPAAAQSPVTRGRVIAKELCAPCHATGRSGASPRRGAPLFRKLGDLVDLEALPARLRQGLSASHPDMPTFRFRASDAEALRVYLQSIQR